MFNKYNITTIINYINLTNHFNKLKAEDNDQTGVTKDLTLTCSLILILGLPFHDVQPSLV